MKTPLDTRGSRTNDGRSARLGKKQPDSTHGHRIAHMPRPPDGRGAARMECQTRRGWSAERDRSGGRDAGPGTGRGAGGVPSGPERRAGRGAGGVAGARGRAGRRGARRRGRGGAGGEARGAGAEARARRQRTARTGGSRRDRCWSETAWGPGSECGNAYRFWYAMLHSLPSWMGGAELRASRVAIGSHWSRWLRLLGHIRGVGSAVEVGWGARPGAIVRARIAD
jgi:hypothetical protein